MTDTATPTRSDTLRALAERVEAGEVTRDLEDTILTTFGWRMQRHGWWVNPAGKMATPPSYLSSLDAVSALQEAVLPGWRVDKIMETTMEPSWRWMCILFTRSVDADISGHGPTEPAARLAACLRALAMEAERAQ